MSVEGQPPESRDVVTRFVTAWIANDVDGIVALLAPDASWQSPRSIGGSIEGSRAIAGQLTGGAAGRYVKVETIRRTIQSMIVDGDEAMVRIQLSATAHSGAEYVNDYAWYYKLSDGLVTRIVEYADTLLAARLGFLPFEASGGGESA